MVFVVMCNPYQANRISIPLSMIAEAGDNRRSRIAMTRRRDCRSSAAGPFNLH
jgi:hypothetical protein